MAAKIELAIVDQNPVVRAGLEALVLKDGRFGVAGVYASGASLIEAIQKDPWRLQLWAGRCQTWRGRTCLNV